MAASKLGSKNASTRPTVGSTLDASALTPPSLRFTTENNIHSVPTAFDAADRPASRRVLRREDAMAASKLGSKNASTRPTVGSTLDASALTPPSLRFTTDRNIHSVPTAFGVTDRPASRRVLRREDAMAASKLGSKNASTRPTVGSTLDASALTPSSLRFTTENNIHSVPTAFDAADRPASRRVLRREDAMAASKLGSKNASTRPTVGSTLDASALTPPSLRFTTDRNIHSVPTAFGVADRPASRRVLRREDAMAASKLGSKNASTRPTVGSTLDASALTPSSLRFTTENNIHSVPTAFGVADRPASRRVLRREDAMAASKLGSKNASTRPTVGSTLDASALTPSSLRFTTENNIHSAPTAFGVADRPASRRVLRREDVMIGLQDNFTFNSRPDAAETSRHTTTCPPFDVPFDEMKRLATRPISGKAAWSHHAASSSPFVEPCTFQNNRRCVTKNERSIHLSDLKGTSSFN
ncbi:unnamed product [Ostreococcus tauri]|uniref:Unnamed product n=1 Tax=Ostreococcus tauri TaxID=70448 RepID=A0A090M8K8_OSTTA|nr:unnamed product [Ostreococcus tauri]CEG01493.1 unnamed product [Ostreococcus tauri]|eukprot:XP_003080798.2 unnamed product [Ostreococcus tauri]